MSERQEDIRRRQEDQALSLRQQQWAGVDPAVIERWAGMVPAGFQFGESRDANDAMSWAPGRVMTAEEVQQVVSNVANNTIEGQGMDLAKYLANPRAAIKVENGQYVYRPESLMPENDFQGIPKTGFWDGMGPAMLPLIAFGAGPFAASLGASAAASAAEAASLAGAESVSGLTASELAALIESGTAGAAGAGIEAAAGIGTLGNISAAELAALIESGTTGNAGLGIEAAAGITEGLAPAVSAAAPTVSAVGESLWAPELAGTMEAGAIGDVAAQAGIDMGADVVGSELASLGSGDLSALAEFDANSFGINSMNSFDTGEMAQVLDRAPVQTSGLPGGSSLLDTQAPANVIDKSFSSGALDANTAGKFLSQATLDKVLKYGPMLLGGLGAVQQKGAVKDASAKIGQLGSSTRAVGENITQGFLKGTLNPADLAGIDKWERDSLAASRQFFARAGTSRSTQATTSEAEITKKAEEMRAQARQNLLTTGINALGVADKYQAAAIEAEMQGDAQMNQYLTNFLSAYGSWMRALPTLTGTAKA